MKIAGIYERIEPGGLNPDDLAFLGGSASHTISLDQYLAGSYVLLPFTKGDWNDIDKRIADIETGSFFSQISPSFGFGLGLRYPLKVLVGYTNIDITGSMTLNPGYHTIVVENTGSLAGKRVVNIRRA